MAAGDSVRAFYARPRLPPRAPRGLRHRLPRLPLARARRSSTGRSTGSTRSPPSAATRRRCGSSRRTARERALHLRRAGARAPTRWPTGCAAQGVRRGDRMIAHARQPGRAVGDACSPAMKLGAVVIPTTTAARARRPARPDGPRRRPARRRRARPTPASSTTSPGDYTRIAVGRRADGLARLRATPTRRRPTFTPDGVTRRRRPAAALLHLRHHRQAQAGRAHPRLLPGRPPVDDVLDRAAARATCTSTSPRRAGPSTPGATSSRRGSPRRRSSSTTTPGSTPAALLDEMARVRGHHLLRAADGLADADPGRPGRLAGAAARGASAPASRSTPRSSSRSAQAWGADRSATASARPRPPRRSATRRASRSSPARWAGRCPGYPVVLRRPGHRRAGATRARSASTSTRARSALMTGYHGDPERNAEAMARRLLPHRRRRAAATPTATSPTSAAPTTCSRPRDYRISPVRAGERADRAPGGRRGRGRARRRTRCGWPCPRRTSCSPPGYEPDAETAPDDPASTPASTSRRTSGSAGSSSPSCPRRSPARSAGSSCGAGRGRVPTVRHRSEEFTL